MSRGETLYVGGKVRSSVIYQAKKIKNGIVIECFCVEWDKNNKPVAVPGYLGAGKVVSVIDGDDYVVSTLKNNDGYQTFFRIPANPYKCELREDLAERFDTDHVIRNKTESGNFINVHLANYDEQKNCFRQLLITRETIDGEFVVCNFHANETGGYIFNVYGEETFPQFSF